VHQHPAHLIAHANLVSLDIALRQLAGAMRRVTVAIRISGDRGTIKAWAPATGPAPVGGHGDPVGDAILHATTVTDHPLAERYRNSVATVCWIAAKVLTPEQSNGQPPMRRLRDHLAGLTPATATELTKWVTEEDRKIRFDLNMWHGGVHLPGVRCPACNHVALTARGDSGFVTCQNETCLCAGDTCPCAMPIRATGYPHIWAADKLSTWRVAA
jgi:hypothetical protein